MAKAGGTYVIGRATPSGGTKVFRSAKSGRFMTTVMSKSTYGSALSKADSAIRAAEKERSKKEKA